MPVQGVGIAIVSPGDQQHPADAAAVKRTPEPDTTVIDLVYINLDPEIRQAGQSCNTGIGNRVVVRNAGIVGAAGCTPASGFIAPGGGRAAIEVVREQNGC